MVCGLGGEEVVPGAVVGDADKLALQATEEAGREAGKVVEGRYGEGGGGREIWWVEAEGLTLDRVSVKRGGVPVGPGVGKAGAVGEKGAVSGCSGQDVRGG